MTTIEAPDPIALACHARLVPATDRETFARRLRDGDGRESRAVRDLFAL